MKSVFKTDCGQIREHNEDNGSVLEKDDVVLAIVVDGMGGHNAGDVASALALATVTSRWSEFPGLSETDKAIEWLKQTIDKANHTIFHEASENEAYKGMGTTLVAALCNEAQVIVANVGDSRGYLLKDHGNLEQITEDHSLVNELVKAGQLSKEDAAYHPNKNVITKAVGTEPQTECDIQQFGWSKGDLLLLCSDGLTDMVKKDTMEHILKGTSSLEEMADQLIKEANDAGGDDNITLTIVEHDGAGVGEKI